MRSIVPERRLVQEAERRALKSWFHRPPDTWVSPVFSGTPFWRRRDGSYIHSRSNVQFFYGEENQVMFAVISILEHCITNSDTVPYPPADNNHLLDGATNSSPLHSPTTNNTTPSPPPHTNISPLPSPLSTPSSPTLLNSSPDQWGSWPPSPASPPLLTNFLQSPDDSDNWL